MQALSLGDRLFIEKSASDALTCSDLSLPCDKTNLVIKALHLFRKKTGLSFPVRIHLEKQIPQEAGLGGGSSNFATTLWGLKELSGQSISTKELMKWAGEVSSDAPFFFSSGRAFCQGRGEKVTSLKPVTPKALWLVKPPASLSTPRVYAHAVPNGCSNEDPHLLMKESRYVNDLEAAAFHLKPELKTLKAALFASGFKTALMTGSGTTFFCFEENEVKFPSLWVKKATFCFRKEDGWF